MAKKDLIVVNGVVTQALPNAMFRVDLENGYNILCVISGKMRHNYIKVLEGDNVKIYVNYNSTSDYKINDQTVVKAMSYKVVE